MNTSSIDSGKRRPELARVALAVALVTLTGGLTLASTLANADDRQGHDNRGAQHADRGNDRGQDRREYRPQFAQPYAYAQPVYAPAPVYVEPTVSPGISLFFPIDIR